MLSSWVKEKLELTGPAESAVIGTWHAQDPSFKSVRIKFDVSSINGRSTFPVNGAYTVPSLNLTKRPVAREKLVRKWPHLADVPLRHVETAEVTLLIGNDHGDMLEIYKCVKDSLKPNAPKGILTPFGWTVTGDVWPAMCDEENPINCRLSLSSTMDAASRLGCYRTTVSSSASVSSLSELVFAVDKFLVQETYGSDLVAPSPVSKEVERWRRMLNESVKFLSELGRYEAGVLWSSDEPNLPDNRRGALERYSRTMRRLERNKDLAAIVKKEMKTNFDLGFAEKLSAEEVRVLQPGRFWVLPWHPVPHPHKPGKWRLVFDGSASFGGSSLNSQLQKGEILNVNMIGILLRMHEFPIVLCGDITKMFHQVRVATADKNIYLFYYGGDLCRMVVHIFGSPCSPAIAMHVLRRAAADADPKDAAIALKEVIEHFYVDNWITSFRAEDEAVSTALALFRALRKGGFELA